MYAYTPFFAMCCYAELLCTIYTVKAVVSQQDHLSMSNTCAISALTACGVKTDTVIWCPWLTLLNKVLYNDTTKLYQ